jgi:formylglycine-generating enzyme required for sulfatase activity
LTKNEPRIFLCHASDDKARVRELYHQLKAAGYHPWLDEEDLLPGQTWRAEIKKIISAPYNLVVVCLSRYSITKRGVVQQEIKWALDVLEGMPEDAIYLIPARLEDCQVPDRLSDWHRVDLFEPNGFEKLRLSLDYEIGKRWPPTMPGREIETPAIIRPRQPFEPFLILIPAGEFLMGSDPDDVDAYGDERPQHTVYLADYYIARGPVTNAQYAIFVEATGHNWPGHREGGESPKGKEDHPVVGVTWYNAMAYCNWLARLTGKPYRLPSEAEWEKAARGTDGRIWPWGDRSPSGRQCNFSNSQGTTPVGQYSPRGDSPYGCVDMAGNVWEWTLSLYGKGEVDADFLYPYDPLDGRENLEAGDDFFHVLRGGAFSDDERWVRCSLRHAASPGDRNRIYGFRVCVAAQQE